MEENENMVSGLSAYTLARKIRGATADHFLHGSNSEALYLFLSLQFYKLPESVCWRGLGVTAASVRKGKPWAVK